MKKKNRITTSKPKLRFSILNVAMLTVLTSNPAYSEEIDNETNEPKNIVTITGSSIKRTDVESSLPVQTITAEDMVLQGLNTVGDLIARIPAMQGFTTVGAAMNSTHGQETASLRDLGSQYTLVLLNGRRMASQDSSNSVDISAIPLAAIERVEVLTDGASALYGSDAIAGVVNFILKDNYEGTTVEAKYNKPQRNGGKSSHFSITHGLGGENYNLLFSYTHDQQEQLRSSQRGYGDTGLVEFNYGGHNLIFTRLSSSAAPANVDLRFNDGLQRWNLNPYRIANGECAPTSIPSDGLSSSTLTERCLYDFTEAVDIFPEKKIDTFIAKGTYNLNSDTELFASLMLAKTETITRAAANTVAGIQLDVDSPIVVNHIIPLLSTEQATAGISRVNLRWRNEAGGPRTLENVIHFNNFSFGASGVIGDDWNYDTAITLSTNARSQNRLSGYILDEGIRELLTTNLLNPFLDLGQQSTEAIDAIRNIQPIADGFTEVDTGSTAFQASISGPVAELPNGEMYIAGGFDYRTASYEVDISELNRTAAFLGATPSTEFDLSRDTYGLFFESIIPVIENLEITAALRYDNIGGITDVRNGISQTVNEDANDTTYKISVAYRPTDELLVRGSIGTGFKTATMRDIANPLVIGGNTSSNWDCPFPNNGDPLNIGCDGRTQYNTATRGNPDLKPETSEQKSIGFVFSPNQSFNMSIDYWQIDLSDKVAGVSEATAFENPERYRELFDLFSNPVQNRNTIHFVDGNVNVGESNNSGIDWAFNGNVDLSFGKFKTSLQGAYMIKSEESVIGGEKGEVDSNLGRFGDSQSVTFQNRVNFNNSLTTGNFVTSLNFDWKSGYVDQEFDAFSSRILYADDVLQRYEHPVKRNVASYMTANFVTRWSYSDDLSVSLGVNNLFDKSPPLSIRSGGGAGVVGYDSRYVDHLLRTFYLKAVYSF